MDGLLRIALKLLINDRGKFFTLIVGVAFSVFLMTQMTATFFGIMQRTAANVINVGAKIWVMDNSVNSAADNITLPDYVLDEVRSISAVRYAVPIFNSVGQAKLADGKYQSVTVIGLDDTTLFGRPQILEGNITSIYNDDAFIVIKDSEYGKLESPKIGASFEINDHRVVIVALGKVALSGLFGTPTLYTTYKRAIKTLPTTRNTISYILIEPKDLSAIEHIKAEVQNFGYTALTAKEFIKKNILYYMFRTGVGLNILTMTLISFVVGLSIAGQTFYTFVQENLEKFGALKAIGARKNELINMILFQSCVVGFIGYGFGVCLASLVIGFGKFRIPNYAPIITYPNLVFSFIMVIIIVAFSSYLGIRKVIRIEPFDIFRG